MANFSITITNSVRSFGPAPSDKWGTGTYNLTWGTAKWGEGTEDLPIRFRKQIDNSQSLTPSSSRYAGFYAAFSESIASQFEGVDERLTDGGGYTYVFPGPSLDADERNVSSYACAPIASETWTSLTVAATTWS